MTSASLERSRLSFLTDAEQYFSRGSSSFLQSVITLAPQACLWTMGGAQSTEIPGGGTEGYHVLRVCFKNYRLLHRLHTISSAVTFPAAQLSISCHRAYDLCLYHLGTGSFPRICCWSGGVFRLHNFNWKHKIGMYIYEWVSGTSLSLLLLSMMRTGVS